MTSYRIAENIGISYEMRTQNKYPEVVNALFSGGKKGYQTVDLDLTHRLSFGTATTYADRDGRTISIDTGDDLQLNNRIAEVKSFLINGENLIAKAKATLSKQIGQIKNCLIGQLQRLSEKTVFYAFNTEATV